MSDESTRAGAQPGYKKLDVVGSARLVALIEAEYKERGETDDAFAAYATAKLGFHIPGGSVQHRRTSLGIPVNGSRRTAATDEQEARIASLEADVASLRAGVMMSNESIANLGFVVERLKEELKETKHVASKLLTNVAKAGGRQS